MQDVRKIEHAIIADDLENLLDHIAWTNTVKPALESHRAKFQTLLVQSVLGQQIIDQNTGGIVSKEMLAGRIEGIDWLDKFLTGVLRRGERALSVLKQEDYRIG
jgi:hypothetical protein